MGGIYKFIIKLFFIRIIIYAYKIISRCCNLHNLGRESTAPDFCDDWTNQINNFVQLPVDG